MSVNRRHETKAHGSSNRLRNFALIHRPKTGLLSVFDASQRRHVFGHGGEILYQSESGMSALGWPLIISAKPVVFIRIES